MRKTSIKRGVLMLMALLGVVFSSGASLHEYELKVGDFTRLHVVDNVNVVWRCNPDSVGYASFTAEPQFADAFILSNNGKGTLKVQVSSEDLGQPGLPTLYVYSSYLGHVQNSGSFTTLVESPTPCAEFKAQVDGNGTVRVENVNSTMVRGVINTGKGTVEISGECTDAYYKMVGTGEIRADELNSNNVECSILGTGSIYCNPMVSLSVKGVGTTKIYYKGAPTIVKKGGGKLINLQN
jgi:hypothetical protein